ncbi:very low-density lipoprotein receptor isoform X2 [Anabrus simplex]|uniref:very low-density lipoprotein receptor isoform X2 n=1 Tax=Anabrus simplex TaxID=316456 RepID=UPI0035A3228E
MSTQPQQKKVLMRALVFSCLLAVHLLQGSLGMAIEGGTCPPDSFMCMDGSQCVEMAKRCDGLEDCPDGTDEYNCVKGDGATEDVVQPPEVPPEVPAEQPSECPEGSFRCKDDDSKCVAQDNVCDGTPHCNDASDEKDCIGKCKQPENFLCHDGRCMTATVFCNGHEDCSDGSDESNCTGLLEESSGEQTSMESIVLPPPVYNKGNCSAFEFHCLDDTCIPINLRCDTRNDCPDGSDELQGCTRPLKCHDGFICPDGHCLPFEWQCDGSKDCLDGSDEMNCNEIKSNRTRRVPFGLVEEERIKNLQEEREFRMEIHRLQLEEMMMKQDVAREELTAVKNASEIAEALAQEQLKIAALERQAAEDKMRQQSELYQLRREAVKPEQATPVL